MVQAFGKYLIEDGLQLRTPARKIMISLTERL